MALTIKNTNLIINTEPEYADQIVDLTSSDENVVVPVSSTESGTTVWTLEPRGTGTATITATTPGGFTSSVEVTVVEGQDDDEGEGGGESEPTPTTVPVENIYFHEPNSLSSEIETLGLALDKSGVVEMNPYVTVLPNNATDKSWRLVSSNTNILGVSGTSVFTKSAGSCSLTVLTSNNCADTISVTVTAIPAESVSFTTSRLDLPIGTTKDLTDYVTFTPALSIYDEYSFRSSRTAVAKVTGNSIKGVSAGMATVTVTTGSGKTDTLIVNVPLNSGSGGSSSDVPLNFYIDCSKTLLEPGEEATVWIRSVDPETFDLTSRGELQLAFTNSRGYVVGSHDESGTFTIKAYDNPGNDTLWMMWRASSKMGWISSNSINFTVQPSGSGSGDTQPVLSSVSISLNTSGIIPGDLIQANVVINPSNYSPSSIVWSSSNTTVATVTNTGYISCIGEGTTVISVTVDGRTATKTLVVGNDNGSEINPPDWSEDDEGVLLLGTNVSDPILPWTAADEYATHYAKYGKGGYRSVSNISERNAIPALRREEGMLVWVISENKLYQLRNGYWIAANLGGNSSGEPGTTPIDGGGCNCEELESRIAALEAILLAQQQEEYERQLDNSSHTVTVSGLQPSGSKYEVGTEVGTLSFNYGLSGPVPVPSMQSAIINGATYSPASGSYSGGAVDSSSSGTKTLYNIEIRYFDTRYGQLDKYKDAGGKLKSATASKNIMFGYKIYCGKTTLGPSDFSWPNLSGSVIGTPAIYTSLPTKSSPLTFSYTITNGRAWVAYPKAWGQNVDIRDSKGDSYAPNFSFKEISVPVAGNSVQYYLYYLTYPSTIESDFEFNFSKK